MASKINFQMEEVNCDLCGGKDFYLVLKGCDYQYFSSSVFNLVKCKSCGLVFLNPRPKDMSNFYPERIQPIEKDMFYFLNTDRAKLIRQLKKKGRILDIGCGQGYFLFYMQRYGWEVYGNELSKTGCLFAKEKLGLKNIYNADLLSIDFASDYFDVVTFWHSLEHLPSPKKTLEKIYHILKPDGILVIELPNFSSLQRKLFREKHYAMDIPRHLYYFSPQVLKKLLSLTGFKIFKKDYPVNLRINFISLKRSILRWIGIERIVDKNSITKPDLFSNFCNLKIIWKPVSFLFNIFCLCLTVVLIIFGADELLRIYCKKIKK